jgi:mevalonate kinase
MIHRIPGRVCLLGEHNDWAGGAALVVPMDRALAVRVTPASSLYATALLEGRALEWMDGEDGPLRFVSAVADVLGEAYGLPRGCAVHVDGDLPAGRGWSSSAALCVGLVRGMLALRGRVEAPDVEAELAARAEQRAGVACGLLDPLACAHGMPLFLRFCGSAYGIESVPARLSLAVGSFPAPRDTPAMLRALGRLRRGEAPLLDFMEVRRAAAVHDALDGFGDAAVRGRDALLAGDLEALGVELDTCQALYEEELLPAVPELAAPGLVRAVRALRRAGALGAKFSGAGGDGSVIGLFRDASHAAMGVTALDGLGLHAFVMELDATP